MATSACPNTSRAATPSRWRPRQRRSARCRSSRSVRHDNVPVADATSTSRSSVCNRSGSASRGIRSGLAPRTSPSSALVPSRLAQAPGDVGAVPEDVRQRRRPPVAGRQLAQAQQPQVGVGRHREPVEQQRQELLHHPRGPRQAPGELAHRSPGPLGIGEPEAGQRAGRRLGRQPARPGQGVEQRAEVEALVDRPDQVPVAGEIAVERLGGTGVGATPIAEHPGHAASLVAVRRHGVGLLLVLDLHGVLDPAQEPVGRRQAVGVVGGDVPAAGHLGQGGQGGGRAQLGVGAAVHELEGLHRELDVADAARAALDVALGSTLPAQLRRRPVAQRSQRPQVVRRPPPTPQRGGGSLGPGPADLGVAGHRNRLQQRLELPRLGPPLPVRPVALDRAGEGPVASLGPQVGVDPIAAAGEVHHRPGVAGVAVDEHHVDVAGVVELAAAELAHADHGQPLGPGQAHRRGHDGRRHIGEVGRGPPRGRPARAGRGP